MKKILIIDAVNYIFRSYYGIGPMTNAEGQSTSALFGFIRSTKKLIQDFKPDYIACVFDGPDNKKSRQALYPDYKIHRKGAPEDLFPQIALTKEFCSLFGLPTVCVEGVEADDSMATIATWAENQKDLEVYLCTSDKDLFQLVGNNTYVLLPHKNNLIVDSEKVKELFGVNPNQILDYLSIVGDASDNIPGLPGFGPKTAVTLLNEFHTLDNILKNPEKVPGAKKQETLKTEYDKAILSKKLATLDCHVELPLSKKFYEKDETNTEDLFEFYNKMNFKKFAAELTESKVTEEKPLPHQTTPPSDSKINYELVNDEETFIKLLDTLSKKGEICVDTETTSLSPLEAKLVGVGFTSLPSSGWYIPFNGKIDQKFIIEKLKPFFSSSAINFYGHNIKYDLHVLANYGIDIKNICFDTILASYLIAPQIRKHSLDHLSLEYFNKTKISYKDLITEDKKKILLQDVDIEKVSNYCCEDVDYTCRLKGTFEKELAALNLEKIFRDMELPLIPVLLKMERNGIFLDEHKLLVINEELSKESEKIEKEIYEEVGLTFNLNSPKQLSDILYNHLKLPPPAKRKTEYSTGSEILNKLALKYDIVKKIIQHRSLQKLLSTYVSALPKQINGHTHRIHPTFNQSVTATGRLSCQDPNLQNIPIKTPEGKRIRNAFKPEHKNWSYIAADYSQIELRLLAHFSNDPELIRAFKNNEDIHAFTAAIVYKVDIKDVTPKMRSIAKAVNFGTIYGQGPHGLSQLINIPYKEAQEFITTYFERYEKIALFIDNCKKEAAETKVSKTLLGRKRPLPEIDNKNPLIRKAAERLAVNTPLQGTAADIIKLAMISIDKEIVRMGLKGFLILQIHDELIFEVPDDEIDMFKKIIISKMENTVPLKVPLTVDLQVGKNWGEC